MDRAPACHDAPAPVTTGAALTGRTALLAGYPRAAVLLAIALGSVALASLAWILVSPFDAAAFGGLTVPVVLSSGFADGLNPCAFALLVLFATYTLTLVNSVTADGTATVEARRRLLGAGSLYVGAVWITYFIIGLGLLSFLSWLGQDHLVTRIAAVLAMVMALWMLKDVFLPGVGPSMMAPPGRRDGCIGRSSGAVSRACSLPASWSASARCPARARSISPSSRSSMPREVG